MLVAGLPDVSSADDADVDADATGCEEAPPKEKLGAVVVDCVEAPPKEKLDFAGEPPGVVEPALNPVNLMGVSGFHVLSPAGLVVVLGLNPPNAGVVLLCAPKLNDEGVFDCGSLSVLPLTSLSTRSKRLPFFAGLADGVVLSVVAAPDLFGV